MATGSRTALNAPLPSSTPSKCLTDRHTFAKPSQPFSIVIVRSDDSTLQSRHSEVAVQARSWRKTGFLDGNSSACQRLVMAKRLAQLGRSVSLPRSPSEAKLESVANPHRDTDYLVRFSAPEFTSLCPVTGQPDFAHFVIDYAPAKSIVESKSLKLF